MIVNKIILGTVQFGLNYGINNKKGQITETETFHVLDLACENGLITLDTAYTYGTSECVIGKYIKERDFHNFKIISKFPSTVISRNESLFFKSSLERLHINKLYGYLFHDFKSFTKKPERINMFRQLKTEGKIEKIGFSLYFPEELNYLLDHNINVDIIQIPYNIFDQRFANLFKKLKDKLIEIHIRSVFLQGLVFKDLKDLDKRFDKLKSRIGILHKLANELKIPISSICLNYALMNPYIDKVIIGIDNKENLKENINNVKYLEKVESIYNHIKTFTEMDENIILPFNWDKNR